MTLLTLTGLLLRNPPDAPPTTMTSTTHPPKPNFGFPGLSPRSGTQDTSRPGTLEIFSNSVNDLLTPMFEIKYMLARENPKQTK